MGYCNVDPFCDDPACDGVSPPPEVQRAVVAGTCTGGSGTILWHRGAGIVAEIDGCGGDCDSIGLDEPPGDGLWIWEGTLDYYTDDEPPRFRGAYRAPTDDEWRCIRLGVSPFQDSPPGVV